MISTTLQDLPRTIKENSVEQLAQWIVKYQRFNLKSALKYAPAGYSYNTLMYYMNQGTKYIKTGKKGGTSKGIYDSIDNFIKQHLQPLTPTISEKKKEFNTTDFTKKENIPPVARLECVTKPLISNFEYGIRFGNRIELFNSEDEAKGFNRGLEYAGEAAGKLISVEIGEV